VVFCGFGLLNFKSQLGLYAGIELNLYAYRFDKMGYVASFYFMHQHNWIVRGKH
jgi:hypothetical protein